MQRRRCPRSHHWSSRASWTSRSGWIRVLPHLLLLAGTRLTRKRWGWSPKRLTALLIRIWRLGRRIHFRKPRPIARRTGRRSRRRLSLLRTRTRVGPLRPRRSNCALKLVSLGVDIGRHGSRACAIGLAVPQELQPRLDVGVGRIQLSRSLIGIQSIIDLVIAALVLGCC